MEIEVGRTVTGGRRPRMVKDKRAAVSAARRERFLEELAATCNVTLACETAKVSTSHVYRLRQKDGAFRAGWGIALQEGYARLEMMMLERAMNGVVKEVRRGDGSVERVTEFSDRIGLQLLKMHKDVVQEVSVEPDEEEVEAARGRVLAKLEKLRVRLEGEGVVTPLLTFA